MFKRLFEELGLSENAHRIYVLLLENGTSSARTLAENLGLPRPSVYDSLKALIQKGLVLEREEGNKKYFQIDDVKNLPRLLSDRIDTLSKEKTALDALLPTLMKQTSSVEPKIRFYSGADGVRQVLKDILWYKDIESMSMWPVREMVDLLGKEYFDDLNRRRIRLNISIRAIWPEDKIVGFKEHPFMGTGGGHLRDLRVGPKDMSADLGYWIYADKVAFVSSRKESFGFVVHSRDFAEMMRSQFEVVWNASKPIRPEPEHTDAFLETV